MKSRYKVFLFVLYGTIIAIAYHFHSMVVHESGFFWFNFVVEKYYIPPIFLYYANDVGDALTSNEILVVRIILSVAFWGGISGIVYAGWWAGKTIKNNYKSQT